MPVWYHSHVYQTLYQNQQNYWGIFEQVACFAFIIISKEGAYRECDSRNKGSDVIVLVTYW